MADLPLASLPALAARLDPVMDLEGKIPRALEALGPLAGRDAAVIDVPGTRWVERVRAVAPGARVVSPAGSTPPALELPDASIDVLVALWTAFRGVDAAELAEADRVLRPNGRLLVVHDYGRDDVSALRDPEAPEYGAWSRRDGPFLRDGGFRIRVIHAFWRFESMEEAQSTLGELGERGGALAERLKRPRLSWNVAVYHRWRGGVEPPEAASGVEPEAASGAASGTASDAASATASEDDGPAGP